MAKTQITNDEREFLKRLTNGCEILRSKFNDVVIDFDKSFSEQRNKLKDDMKEYWVDKEINYIFLCDDKMKIRAIESSIKKKGIITVILDANAGNPLTWIMISENNFNKIKALLFN